MKSGTAVLILLVFLFFSCRAPDHPYSKHFIVQKIAPGVWAAINNDNYGHAICNAGIIDLGDKTLVFDPFMNIDAANDLRSVAMELTKKPVTVVVNSHYHNDHIRGNQVFMPGASIISTEWTREEMAISEPKEIAWEKENAAARLADAKEQFKNAKGFEKEELPKWIGYYEGMVASNPILKTTLPNFTFHDSLWVYGEKTNVKLVECKNGHTASDLILLLPKEGIVFMGDLFFVSRHPYLGDGSSKGVQEYLQLLEEENAYSQFVPGHGPVGGKKELNELIGYIKDSRQFVLQQINQNIPDSIIVKSPIPEAYKTWFFPRFYGANLAFLCEELRKN